MRHHLMFVAVAVLVSLGISPPAGADVDDNPNAVETVDVTCDDGTTFESVWSVPGSGVAHDLEGKRIAVATSVYATIEGVPVGALFDRPGVGLDRLTVWCVWNEPASPTGQAGADTLIVGRR